MVELSFTPFTETLYFKRASRRLWIYSSFLHPYVMPASHHPHPSLTPASASELGLRSPLSHGVLFTSFASQDLNSWLLLPASHLKCSAPVVFFVVYFVFLFSFWSMEIFIGFEPNLLRPFTFYPFLLSVWSISALKCAFMELFWPKS